MTREQYLDVPVVIKVVQAGDAPTISVGVVHVAGIARTIAWVAGNHRLPTNTVQWTVKVN